MFQSRCMGPIRAPNWWYDGAAIDLDFQNGRYIDNNPSVAALMLHMDGADASTTFTDSTGRHVVSVTGNAQIDNAQSKFGGTSGLFDGGFSYLAVPSDSDFIFGTGDFTIDFWVRFSDRTGGQDFIDFRAGGSSDFQLAIYKETDHTIRFAVQSGVLITGTTVVVNNTWYHIALTRSGSSTKLFLNGTQEGSTYTDSNNYTVASEIRIGSYSSGTSIVNGWMDEFRIIKGRAIWVKDFIPPSVPYTSPFNTPIDYDVYRYLSCSRASIGYAQNSMGMLQQFPSDSLRITDLGLLIEAARTNKALWSQVINSTNWSLANISLVNADDTIAPDNTMTADLLSFSASCEARSAVDSVSLAADETVSAYVKPKIGTDFYLGLTDGTANSFGHSFVLSGAGSLGTDATAGGATVTSKSITALANGWYRVTVTGQAPSWVGVQAALQFSSSPPGNTLWVWGAQWEIGNFASSYIPTTTAAATRAADTIASIGNAKNTWLSSASSFVVDMKMQSVSVIPEQFVFGDQFIRYVYLSSGLSDRLQSWNGGADLIAISSGNWLNGCKGGQSWDGAGRILCMNGTSVRDTNTFSLGSALLGGAGYFGYMRRITGWNVKLSADRLQRLTAP